MKTKVTWENLGYFILFGLIMGQIFIGHNFVIGESIYVITDIIIILRDFKLKRPKSDIIKNGVLTLLASGALVTNIVM